MADENRQGPVAAVLRGGVGVLEYGTLAAKALSLHLDDDVRCRIGHPSSHGGFRPPSVHPSIVHTGVGKRGSWNNQGITGWYSQWAGTWLDGVAPGKPTSAHRVHGGRCASNQYALCVCPLLLFGSIELCLLIICWWETRIVLLESQSRERSGCCTKNALLCTRATFHGLKKLARIMLRAREKQRTTPLGLLLPEVVAVALLRTGRSLQGGQVAAAMLNRRCFGKWPVASGSRLQIR